MPICFIGEVFEFQCQLVVAVTLGVIVFFHVLSQHETIDDVPVAQSLGIVGYVVRMYFDVCTVRYGVFEPVSSVVWQSRMVKGTVAVSILPFVGHIITCALHILVKIQRGSCFIVRTEMGATYRDTMVRTTFPVFKIFCYISFMISNDFSINHIILWHVQGVPLFSHVIILSQITL